MVSKSENVSVCGGGRKNKVVSAMQNASKHIRKLLPFLKEHFKMYLVPFGHEEVQSGSRQSQLNKCLHQPKVCAVSWEQKWEIITHCFLVH